MEKKWYEDYSNDNIYPYKRSLDYIIALGIYCNIDKTTFLTRSEYEKVLYDKVATIRQTDHNLSGLFECNHCTKSIYDLIDIKFKK